MNKKVSLSLFPVWRIRCRDGVPTLFLAQDLAVGGGGNRLRLPASRDFRLPPPCATSLFPSPWRRLAAQKYEASSHKQAGLICTLCLLGKQSQKREAKMCLNIIFATISPTPFCAFGGWGHSPFPSFLPFAFFPYCVRK